SGFAPVPRQERAEIDAENDRGDNRARRDSEPGALAVARPARDAPDRRGGGEDERGRDQDLVRADRRHGGNPTASRRSRYTGTAWRAGPGTDGGGGSC